MTGVAIYCRLSSEDKNKKGRQKDSESIQNQKTMLIEYAMQNGWEIYKIYADDDYSGTDVSRPEWNALISDAGQGKFQVVLAKTQSRFIRDVKSMEYILHDKFPKWGIRFISLVDQMDTAKAGNKKARQITGLMNDWYVEDLSDNLRATLKAKKKQGKFVGAFCCYGYQKDPKDKNKLVIDEEAATVVRRIYQMYLDGLGNTAIAKKLNAEGIPCPTAYKRLKGSNFKKARTDVTLSCWRDTTVSLILKTQTYAGDLVQHKNTTVSYKNQKKMTRPRAEWIIVENTHEPIIDREIFQKVRQLSHMRTRPQGSGLKHLFAGKVKCGYCGSTLVKNGSWGGHVYLRCRVAAADQRTCEKGAAIPYEVLYKTVLEEIQKVIGLYASEELICNMIEEKSVFAERQDELIRASWRFEGKIADLEKATSNLYIDKMKEIITESQFISISRQFETDKQRLQNQLAQVTEQYVALQNPEEKCGEKRLGKDVIVSKYIHLTELTRGIIHEFIDYISIRNLSGEKGRMKREIIIYWNV